MRNLPKKFIIFGQEVKVEYADLDGHDGLSHEKGLIQIDENLSSKKVKQILLHEFLHSVFYRASLDSVVKEETEELIVEAISKAICENFDIKAKKL